jgi:NADPH2:quinone reductase
VLITAAAGGIGSLLVQAARSAGATVIGGAGGPEKAERVRALGADVAIDYNAPGWTDAIRDAAGAPDGTGGVTVALDGVGGAIGRAAFECLAPGGRLIVFGGASGGPIQFDVWELYRRGLTVSAAIGRPMRERRALEARALAAAADGQLVPALHHFPLHEAAAAHAAIERRATMGKVVLIP